MTLSEKRTNADTHRPQLCRHDLATSIGPRARGDPVPLTADQRYMFRSLIHSNPEQRPLSVRMCASATRISGPLNFGLLERCIAGLLQRHEALRTTFRTCEGLTTQYIDPPGEYRLICVDLSFLSRNEAERESKRLSRLFQDQKIDLSIGPVFEARLFKLAVQEHVLIVLADHMISDEMSNAVLDKEIWQA